MRLDVYILFIVPVGLGEREVRGEVIEGADLLTGVGATEMRCGESKDSEYQRALEVDEARQGLAGPVDEEAVRSARLRRWLQSP